MAMQGCLTRQGVGTTSAVLKMTRHDIREYVQQIFRGLPCMDVRALSRVSHERIALTILEKFGADTFRNAVPSIVIDIIYSCESSLRCEQAFRLCGGLLALLQHMERGEQTATTVELLWRLLARVVTQSTGSTVCWEPFLIYLLSRSVDMRSMAALSSAIVNNVSLWHLVCSALRSEAGGRVQANFEGTLGVIGGAEVFAELGCLPLANDFEDLLLSDFLDCINLPSPSELQRVSGRPISTPREFEMALRQFVLATGDEQMQGSQKYGTHASGYDVAKTQQTEAARRMDLSEAEVVSDSESF